MAIGGGTGELVVAPSYFGTNGYPGIIKIYDNRLYLADAGNHQIASFSLPFPTGGYSVPNCCTIIGISGINGCDSNKLNFPQGIAFDSAKNLYIADAVNNRIQKFTYNAVATNIVDSQHNLSNLTIAPNPTDFKFAVCFSLKKRTEIIISIYDLTGRRVLNIPSSNYVSGVHKLIIETNDLANGSYLVIVDDFESKLSTQLMVKHE